MAVGNVLGSNIFNIFAVMGIPRLFGTLDVPESVLVFSLPLLLVTTILTLFILHDREVNRWEGFILLLLYILFIVNLATQEIYSLGGPKFRDSGFDSGFGFRDSGFGIQGGTDPLDKGLREI